MRNGKFYAIQHKYDTGDSIDRLCDTKTEEQIRIVLDFFFFA